MYTVIESVLFTIHLYSSTFRARYNFQEKVTLCI